MGELGLFHGQRVELIEGEIMVLSPQGPPHSYFTDHVAEVLRDSAWPGVWVRMQFPIDFGPYSEPEPDVSVVPGSRNDHDQGTPSRRLLVVEVSDSTLAYDRGRKASLYAMRGIADYWIVNIVDDQLEVRRDPRPDPSQPFGHGYASLTVLRPGDVVSRWRRRTWSSPWRTCWVEAGDILDGRTASWPIWPFDPIPVPLR